MDGMQTPPGITECNQSYFTGNSFSVPHSAQQLQHGTPATLALPPASIQEVNAPASPGVISSSLLSRNAFSSPVTADPIRNGTGGGMPLAEAITQLSFLEFLQRCGVSIAPPQSSQPTVLDAIVQTAPPCDVSQEGPRRHLISQPPRYLSTWQCRRLPTVSTSHLWMLLRRRPHPALRLSMFLRRWVLAQLPRFLLMRLCRLLHIVLY